MLTNILLYLAAVDDDVSYDEAAYITEVYRQAHRDMRHERRAQEPRGAQSP